jgi:hypothetical protein
LHSKKPSHIFSLWKDTLPANFDEFDWTTQEKSMLQGSGFDNYLGKYWVSQVPGYKEFLESIGPTYAKRMSFEFYIYWFRVFRSRTFASRFSRFGVLAPYGDLLNHCGRNYTVEWHWDPRKEELVFNTDSVLPAYREIFISYGRHLAKPHKSIIQYGFIERIEDRNSARLFLGDGFYRKEYRIPLEAEKIKFVGENLEFRAQFGSWIGKKWSDPENQRFLSWLRLITLDNDSDLTKFVLTYDQPDTPKSH